MSAVLDIQRAIYRILTGGNCNQMVEKLTQYIKSLNMTNEEIGHIINTKYEGLSEAIEYLVTNLCHVNSNKLLKIFINFGADLNYINKYGENLLHAACEYDCNNILLTLIKSGIDVNAKNIYGITAIRLLKYNNHKGYKILLENGAYPNYVYDYTCTIGLTDTGIRSTLSRILYSFDAGENDKLLYKIVQLFLKHGADLEL